MNHVAGVRPGTQAAMAAPYRAPWWLPGGHAQTIYASVMAPRPRVQYRRERWETPDCDFIDLDWVEETATAPASAAVQAPRPLLVLFHGLEGSSRSHYSAALMAAVRDAGWHGVVVHFRGCSGEANRLPRAYHSGDAIEVDWILRRLRAAFPHAPLHAAGVSLGGNALLKYLGEHGRAAQAVVSSAAAVSAPLDLLAAGDALGSGFNLLYARYFLRSLKPKAYAKHALHPGLIDLARLRLARTLRAFDDVVTAPLHGFRDTDDYWSRASSKPVLPRIAVPTLVINAIDDPFMPPRALPGPHEVSDAVTLEQPAQGGHCAFVSGRFPGHLGWLPRRILAFFRREAERATDQGPAHAAPRSSALHFF